MTNTADDRWLKPQQVARMFGCNPATLRKQRREGTGPTWSQFGPRLVRYLESDVIKWMAGNTHDTHERATP